jgi:hypothetical protein
MFSNEFEFFFLRFIHCVGERSIYAFCYMYASFGSINFSQEKKTLVKERTNKEFLNKRDRTIF